MKSIFGIKSFGSATGGSSSNNSHSATTTAGTTNGTTTSSRGDHDRTQQQQQQQQQQNQKGISSSRQVSTNDTKKQPLIESSRTPTSATSAAATAAKVDTSTMMNHQQLNKKKIKKKVFSSLSRTPYSSGQSNHQNSTATTTTNQLEAASPADSANNTDSIGYATSMDQPSDLTTVSTTTTALISLVEPPSSKKKLSTQPYRTDPRSITTVRMATKQKLPPIPIQATSQQQYQPPQIMTSVPTSYSSSIQNHDSIDDSTTVTNHSNNYNSTNNYSGNKKEHLLLTYPRRSIYNNLPKEQQQQLHRLSSMKSNRIVDNDDEVDSEYMNRLLSSTMTRQQDQSFDDIDLLAAQSSSLPSFHPQQVTTTATTTTSNANATTFHMEQRHRNDQNIVNDDNDADNEEDDNDIVPFYTCFVPKRSNNNNNNNNNSNFPAATSVRFQNNNHSDEIASNIPSKQPMTCYTKFQYYFVRTGCIYIVIVVFTAISMLYGLSNQLSYSYRHRNHHHSNGELRPIRVAFMGNAYFFVNDIPRLVERISYPKYIDQTSCLHAGGSLSDLWVTGNGMYNLWQTDEAMIEYYTTTTSTTTTSGNANDDATVSDDATEQEESSSTTTTIATTYDYGYCTILQLLQGYDKYMSYGNSYGKYYSDGLNPCIMDRNYNDFIYQQTQQQTSFSYDYIILVEQTKRMAVLEARNETITFLKNRYGPLIKSSGAIPVIVDTHAFWSSKSNMTGMVDIPTFAALIAQGVSDFIMALSSVLPSYQAPIVAPIGLAYLTVWEEDTTLWNKLFLDDGIHSSVYGSYLFACVLFATLFDQLPLHPNTDGGDGSSTNNNKNKELNNFNNIASMFVDARKIVGQASYPNAEEAEYLWNVAGRVTLRSYVPPSLLDAISTLQQQQSSSMYGNR